MTNVDDKGFDKLKLKRTNNKSITYMESPKSISDAPEKFDWDAFERKSEVVAVDPGKVVEDEVFEGEVIKLSKYEVVVNISGKGVGSIPSSEFRYNPDLKVGDRVEVCIESAEDKNGQIVLSHSKARSLKSWNRVNEAFKNDEIVRGFIKSRAGGGMEVEIFGLKAFLPQSQIDFKPIHNYYQLVGTTMDFKIVKINHEFHNIVVSHKRVLEGEEPDNGISIEDVSVGQTLTGRVRNIREFGVFIDLGGFDGMVHRSNLSWKSFNDPREIVSVWDQVKVVVLGIKEGKIELGMKQLTPDPWSTIENDYPIGTNVDAKISNIVDYGVFAELPSGIVGLIHNNELQWGGKTSKEELKKGDSIKVQIINIDIEKKQLSLSRDKVTSSEFLETHPIGYLTSATVIQSKKQVTVDIDGIRTNIVDDNSLMRYTLTEGSTTQVLIKGLTKNGISCSIQEYEKQLIERTAKQIHPGDVIESEVAHILNDAVIIKSNDICGIIPKNELSVNPVSDIFKEVFVGETIRVVYLECRDGKLIFGKKYLDNTDIYPQELYDLGVDNLLKQMSITHNCFIGHSNGNGFVNNLHVYYPGQERGEDYGNLLLDPVTGRNIGVSTPRQLSDKEGFFVVSLQLANRGYREEKHCPFIFNVVPNYSFEEKENPYTKDVELAYKTLTSPKANTALANLLEEVGQNMYSSKGRMFFELLQNADDASSANGVSLKVQSKGDYLIITHDGFAFSKNDFDSITSAAKSTKSSNKKKTGYKGIGFKSVFTNSDAVFIKSGGYSFAFDKSNPDYSDFETFYYTVNDLKTDHEKIEFKNKFAKEYREFNMVDDIPWQLLPIQKSEFPKDISRGDFTSPRNNVAIALRMDPSKINEYLNDIEEVLSTPQFVLFLRNTKRIQLVRDGVITTISKAISNDRIQVKTSAQNDSKDVFYKLISGGAVGVSNDEFIKASVPIEKVEIINKRGEKELIFIPLHDDGTKGERIPGIPNRIPSSDQTEITFAVPINADGKIEPISTRANSFFAYLPMDEARFHLPFYVNADFILMSNREGIQCDNPWNYFLFYHIGRKILDWVTTYATPEQPDYLKLLPKEKFNESDSSLRALSGFFNKGFLNSLEEVPFILGDDNCLHTQDDILIDETGLSGIIGVPAFREMLGARKHLPHSGIDSSPLKATIFSKITKVTFENLMPVLARRTEIIKTELSKLNSNTLTSFFNWVSTNSQECKSLIPNLPILNFDGIWYSESEFKILNNHIISSEKVKPVKGILEKLGFLCSENEIDTHPLSNSISVPSDKDVFELISKANFSPLSFQEREMLFTQLCSFTGVGEAKIKEIAIFKNCNGVLKPLKDMTKYSATLPIWLHEYMLTNAESNFTTEKYSVSPEQIFPNIIEPHLTELVSKTDVLDVYAVFKSSWKNSMTTSLINNSEVDANSLLSIIEESDASTKQTYVKNLNSLELSSTSSYSKGCREYRVLQLCAATPYLSCLIKDKITIDGKPLKEFSIKDSITFTVDRTTVILSLSKVVPTFSESSTLCTILSHFSEIQSIEAIFNSEEETKNNVKNRLCTYLECCNYPTLSPEQFAFFALYEKEKGHVNFEYNLSSYIKVNDQKAFVNIIDFFYQKNLDVVLKWVLESRSITYPINLNGLYINSDDYTLATERVPTYISLWANSEEKISFLVKLGVHNDDGDEISRRKSFKSCLNEDIWNISSYSVINKFLAWVKESFQLPICDPNQVNVLRSLFLKRGIDVKRIVDDFKPSYEWNDERYRAWKKQHSFSILIYNGELPYRGVYENKLIFTGKESDYFYSSNNKTLYINGEKDIAPIMSSVYSDSNIPFTKDDWNAIFMISVDSVKDLSQENQNLKARIAELERENNETHREGKETDRGDKSKEEQAEINRQLRIRAKSFLQCRGFDVSQWDANSGGPDVERKIIDPNGNYVNVAIRSASGKKVHLSASSFEMLVNDKNNILIIEDSNEIHSVDFQELFGNNANVNLIFDANQTPLEYFVALARFFKYIKNTDFVIENPTYSAYDEIKTFGLDVKNEGTVIIDNSENDI